MKAIEISEYGGREVLCVVDVTLAQPGPDEVLIRLDYVGVNFFDIYIRDLRVKRKTLPSLNARRSSCVQKYIVATGFDQPGTGANCIGRVEIGERVARNRRHPFAIDEIFVLLHKSGSRECAASASEEQVPPCPRSPWLFGAVTQDD